MKPAAPFNDLGLCFRSQQVNLAGCDLGLDGEGDQAKQGEPVFFQREFLSY
jgi:hypothetical protein